MSCRIVSHTDNEIETSVIKGVYLDPVLFNQSQEETLQKIRNIQNKFTLAEVDNSKLPKGYYLNESGKTMRYTLLSNTYVFIPKRATDINKEKFVQNKGVDKAREIAENPINKIKAEIGTRLHGVQEQLLLHISEARKDDNVITDKSPSSDFEQLKKDSGLSPDDFKNLVNEAKYIYDLISDTQKEIDPNGKVYLFPEMFLLQVDKKGLIGRTLDVVAIYSDNTASHFDFKFKSPKASKKSKNPLTGKVEITEFDWISPYDMEDYVRQIGDSAEVLQSQYGIKGMRHNRIIPAHFEIAFTDKDTPTDKITQLSIGESMNKYLTHIPIGEELTNNKSKQETVVSLSNIKNNLEIQLNNETKQERKVLLRDKIKKLTEAIKLVQVNDDISGVLVLYNSIANKYVDNTGKIKVNLKEELIDSNTNPYYISDKDLVDLYQQLQVINSIVNDSTWYSEDLKLSKERISSINNLRKELNDRIGLMINNIKEEIVERTLSLEDLSQLEDTVDLGMTDKWFQTFGQINNPIFKKAKSLLDKSFNTTRLESQEFYKKLKKVTLALQDNQGKRRYKTFDILINKETGNLYSMYTPEFHKMISEAVEKKDLEVLKKYMSLKPNAETKYEEIKEKIKATEEGYERWLSDHPNVESMLTTKYRNTYYKYNDEAKEFFTEGYKKITQNEAVLDYYNFWTKHISDFKEMLDIDSSEKISSNFVPWIRASLTEQVVNGDFGSKEFLKSLKDLYNVHEATETFGQQSGKIDLITHDNLHQIPKYFINPLLDSDNNINIKEKSMDLSKSMMIFAGMAFNYKNMKEIEGTILALKEVLATSKVIKTDDKGNSIKNILGGKNKVLNPEIDTLFNDMINYHLYGVKIKGEKKKLIEIARKTKNYTQMYQLGFAPMTMLSSYTASAMSRWMESGKGYYFTDKQQMKSRRYLMGVFGNKTVNLGTKEQTELSRALCGFFEVHQGKQTHLKGQDLSANQLIGNWLENAMFWGYRKGDELQENTVLISMMQNYGLDENGNIKRLKNLPKDTKSLFDNSSIVDGKLHIDGFITDGKVNIEAYTTWRNMVMNINKGIKGSMNEEDMNAINMNLLGNMMMSFKNWIPGLAEERFSGIKYNHQTKAVTIGRWRAFTSDLPSKEEAGIIKLIASGIGKATIAMADGLTFNKLNLYKVNEERARILFEEFKQKNLNNSEIQSMSFEDFIDYKKGQIKTFSREAAMILMLVGAVLALGFDWDDDEEPDYKKYYATRKLFQLTNRTRRELMFFTDPTEILTTAGTNVLPQIGLATDLKKAFSNTFDEFRDLTFGENSEYDQSPSFYRSIKFIPGYKFVSTMFEPFEVDKDKQF